MKDSRQPFLFICCLLVASTQALPRRRQLSFRASRSRWNQRGRLVWIHRCLRCRRSPSKRADSNDGARAYVRKFDAYGAELWTRQFDGPSAAPA